MEFVYRFLGLIAGWNEGMSRRRVNFVPFNWIVVGGLGALFVTSIACLHDGLTMNHTPIRVTVNDLMTNPALAHKFVTVSGELEPDVAYQYGEQKSGGSFDVENTWMLLTEPKSPRGFFVEVPNEYFDDKKPRQVTLTGTWIDVASNLAPKLGEENFGKEGLTVNTSQMLNAKAEPPEPAGWAAALVLSAMLLASFVGTFLCQYTVFRAQGAPGFSMNAAQAVAPPAIVRATGEFMLEGRARRRFLNVATNPRMLENGWFAFLSNIDASSRFFGIKTNNQAGIWMIGFPPSSVRDLTRGSFYLGGRAAPAIRFRYQDGAKGSSQSAILGFASDQEREAVFAELERMSARIPVA